MKTVEVICAGCEKPHQVEAYYHNRKSKWGQVNFYHKECKGYYLRKGGDALRKIEKYHEIRKLHNV